ncbi:GNAT family N-acetyltransferase [Gluconobacter cerinus]|nr:GNAT family N-acetyltransferase [Gluconobacter cerinus]
MFMIIAPNLASRNEASSFSARCNIDAVDRDNGIWSALSQLEETYPGFRNWYWNKVVPGLRTGERRIFLIGSAASPKGIAIAKKNYAELKICTLWVTPSERGRGLGRKLLEDAVEWVGVDRPLFTVPHERYKELLPLTKKLGFYETAQIRSLYRLGVVEHIFNGVQSMTLSS